MLKTLKSIVLRTLFFTSVLSYAASLILLLLKYYFEIAILAPYDLLDLTFYLFAAGMITAMIFNCMMSYIYGDEIIFAYTDKEQIKLQKLLDELQ